MHNIHLNFIVLWKWDKNGSYQWVTRGHCDSSSSQVALFETFSKSFFFFFNFSEIFSGIQKSIVKYEEFEGCIEPDCIWADQEVILFGYRKIQIIGVVKIWKWYVLIYLFSSRQYSELATSHCFSTLEYFILQKQLYL